MHEPLDPYEDDREGEWDYSEDDNFEEDEYNPEDDTVELTE